MVDYVVLIKFTVEISNCTIFEYVTYNVFGAVLISEFQYVSVVFRRPKQTIFVKFDKSIL